jgi:hypothetical protein
MTITSVDKMPSGRWIITDSTGTRYQTRSMFLASVADRCRELGKDVTIVSGSGFYDRELREIVPVMTKAKTEVA